MARNITNARISALVAAMLVSTTFAAETPHWTAAVANPDGSTTVYFGPSKPADAKAGNWIQTTPGKGYFLVLRRYSPKQSFFDKSWRPSEVALVK